jgi:hypothetical protein
MQILARTIRGSQPSAFIMSWIDPLILFGTPFFRPDRGVRGLPGSRPRRLAGASTFAAEVSGIARSSRGSSIMAQLRMPLLAC